MSTDPKLQNRRKNPNKPSVVSDSKGIWWAQVHDLNGQLEHGIFHNQQDALAHAYELAALVESQRHNTEATA